MTQKSFPWQGVAPASGTDAGRYNADEWWAVWMSMATSGGVLRDIATPLRTDTSLANKGVFYAVPNRLVVTSSGANLIEVGTGAGLVDGNFFYGDAQVSLTVPSPAANPRIDRIVLRKNYSASTYTPAGSIDTDEQVPALTTRVTRLVGAENAVPVAPSLTQDATKVTYWDVPLFQYQISVAGAITAITDERDWIDAEENSIFVPVTGSENTTDGGVPLKSQLEGLRMEDNKSTTIHSTWQVPVDYISGFSVSALIRPNATGDVYIQTAIYWAACGEDYATDSDSSGLTCSAVAVTKDYNECAVQTLSDTVAIGDIVSMQLWRDATDILDTVNDVVFAPGFIVTYFGWKR